MNISEIYSKAWKVTKNNKSLWVIGLALAGFTGGGFTAFQSSSNFRGSFNSSDLTQIENTSNTLKPLLDYIGSLLSSVPTGFWALLIISILIASLFGIAFSIIAQSWAKGALIGGIDEALNERQVSISIASRRGIKSLRPMIWLTLVPGFLFGVFFLLAALLGIALLITLPPLGAIYAGIGFLLFGIILILITTSIIWAERIVVIDGKDAKAALFEGWHIAKNEFINMAVLGIVNTITSCLIGCCSGCLLISIVATLAVFVIGSFAINPAAGISFGVAAMSIAILVIMLGIFINGIILVFKYSTWNVFYGQIRQGENHE